MRIDGRTSWAARAVLGVTVLVALAAAAPAAGTTGTMYITTNITLTEDHAGSIQIGANSVTLDCANHSVTGAGGTTSDFGISINAGKTNVTIKNCRTSGFRYGIYAVGVSNFQLSNNVSTDNTLAGVFIAGSQGTVVGNVASHNGDGIAFGGFGQASDVAFTSNTMNANSGDGFKTYLPSPQAHYDSGLRLSGNTSAFNGDSGFELNGLTDGIELVGNHATNNGGVGFIAGYADGYTFDGNVATGNTYAGFSINASSHDVIKNNLATGNNTGFINDRVTGSMITDNIAGENAYVGIWMSVSSGNLLARNTSNHNAGDGFWVRNDNGSAVNHNSATSNDGAGYVIYQSSGTAFDENTATNNGHVGFTLNLSSQISLSHNVSNNNDSGFIAYLSTANSFIHNIANGNTGTGFAIYAGSTGNLLRHNVGHANGSYDALEGNPVGANNWTVNNFGTTNVAGLD